MTPAQTKKRNKAAAKKIKKAQTLLRQAYNLVKPIMCCQELDMAKYAIMYGHNEMNAATLWLDKTSKDPLAPTEKTAEVEAFIDVEIEAGVY